jgi:hypothetical protein
MLLQRALCTLNLDVLPVILSPQLLRVLVASLSGPAGSAEHLLAPLASQTLEVLVKAVG